MSLKDLRPTGAIEVRKGIQVYLFQYYLPRLKGGVEDIFRYPIINPLGFIQVYHLQYKLGGREEKKCKKIIVKFR